MDPPPLLLARDGWSKKRVHSDPGSGRGSLALRLHHATCDASAIHRDKGHPHAEKKWVPKGYLVVADAEKEKENPMDFGGAAAVGLLLAFIALF